MIVIFCLFTLSFQFEDILIVTDKYLIEKTMYDPFID